jgi:coenzyme F420-reducing hydrogenase alpha subunit
MTSGTRTIEVNYLARVEGEGSLFLRVEDDEVREARLSIFEPPRFFEAFLRGRAPAEAPDITARICGICPVAYQMSAVAAIEDAAGVSVSPEVRALRRLLYCGEWIGSHVLHIYMLHAPDFLGHEDVVALAKVAPQVVERGLRLRRAGNAIMRLVGGREVHPINVRVGGFYAAPSRRDMMALAVELKWARDAAIETVRWAAGLPMPDCERDYVFVALRGDGGYPLAEGRIAATTGLDIAPAEFADYFEESHEPHSTALHARMRDGTIYLTGPLARFALNRAALTPAARQAADDAGLGPVCRNPFQSIVVRAVEVVFACEEALRLIEDYVPPRPPFVEVEPRSATGHGATEAPRGLLYHRYRIGDDGLIAEAAIVPPTSQNQAAIESDVRDVAAANLGLTDPELQWRLEQTIRNFDPCISCAAHFLRLEVSRR